MDEKEKLMRKALVLFVVICCMSNCGLATTWIGSTSNDWFTPSNWSDGVPAASTVAVVPSGATVMLAKNAAATALDIDISSGATVTMTDGILNLFPSDNRVFNGGGIFELQGGVMNASLSENSYFRSSVHQSGGMLNLKNKIMHMGPFTISGDARVVHDNEFKTLGGTSTFIGSNYSIEAAKFNGINPLAFVFDENGIGSFTVGAYARKLKAVSVDLNQLNIQQDQSFVLLDGIGQGGITNPSYLSTSQWTTDFSQNPAISDATVEYLQNDAGDYDLQVRVLVDTQANAIPEPLTFCGALLGIGAVGGRVRRRLRRA
jgi:hypothetical protein